MANPASKSLGMSARSLLVAAVLLAVVSGGVTGYGTAILSHSSPSAQNRDFYLFAQDQHFSDSQVVSGLTSDYVYSSTHIVVNKGDTLTIHFYNPTDQTHSFTMASPYSNDAIVQAATNVTISKQDIVLTTTTAGIFAFHCKFHSPQMMGIIVVQQ